MDQLPLMLSTTLRNAREEGLAISVGSAPAAVLVPGPSAGDLVAAICGPSEIEKRDRVLDALAERRRELVARARELAESIARERGRVTAPDVFAALRAAGVDLGGHDPRWMGAVFNRGRWRRVGWQSTGSHARPVAVWELDEVMP